MSTNSNFTLGTQPHYGSININTVSASNVFSMGGGSGHLNIGSWWDSGIDADGNVTIDTSSFGGTIDTKRINASGALRLH